MPSHEPLHSAFGMFAPLGSVTAELEFDLQPIAQAARATQRMRFFMRVLFCGWAATGFGEVQGASLARAAGFQAYATRARLGGWKNVTCAA